MPELTPMQDAWLRAQQMTETFSGFTAHEIETMSMAQFARLTGRQARDVEPPGTPRQAPEPAQAPAPKPEGIDVASLDMQQYAQLRGQLGMGRGREYGRGILDAAASGSEAAGNAARAPFGRTAWSTSNVTEPPQLERPYVKQDEHRDTRSLAGRFSDQSTYFRPGQGTFN